MRFSAPHVGESFAPQLSQKRAPSRFSAPHFEQRIQTPGRVDAYRRTLTDLESCICVRRSNGQALFARQGSSVTRKSAIIDRASARREIL
jgi:hypothetical protein